MMKTLADTMKAIALKAFSLALLAVTPATVKAGASQEGSAYDFTFAAIDGKPMPLDQFRGRVLLVVNTASFCGFTPQYKGLQALHENYEAKGFDVIGVPSNDFGGQEPGTADEIKEFCEGAMGVTFPLAEKAVVKGPDAHPFYKWALANLGPKAAPGWNFHKYLVGRDGKLIASFFSGAAPDSRELISAIEAALSKPAAAD